MTVVYNTYTDAGQARLKSVSLTSPIYVTRQVKKLFAADAGPNTYPTTPHDKRRPWAQGAATSAPNLLESTWNLPAAPPFNP